jgi:hypothetical protein
VREWRLEVRAEALELAGWRARAAERGLSLSGWVRERVNRALAAELPLAMLEMDAWGAGAGEWRELFLAALRVGGSVSAACRAAGVSRTLVYRERCRSREFAASWELAREGAEQLLSDCLHAPAAVLAAPLGLRAALAERRQVGREGWGVRRRQGRLQVRLSEAEWSAWREAAAAAGLSVSGLVRRLVRGRVAAAGARECRPGSWRPVFLEGLRATGFVSGGCRAAGITRALAYSERQQSQSFAFAWQLAENAVRERELALLWEWGFVGVPTRKTTVRRCSDGSVITSVHESRRYSTWALIELLCRRVPDRFQRFG